MKRFGAPDNFLANAAHLGHIKETTLGAGLDTGFHMAPASPQVGSHLAALAAARRLAWYARSRARLASALSAAAPR